MNEYEAEGGTEGKANFNGKGEDGVGGAFHAFAGLVFIVVNTIGGHNHRHKGNGAELEADEEEKEVEENGEEHAVGVVEPGHADEERDDGNDKAIDGEHEVGVLFAKFLNKGGAEGHTDDGADGGDDAEDGNEVLAAEEDVGGLNLDAHGHLTAEA